MYTYFICVHTIIVCYFITVLHYVLVIALCVLCYSSFKVTKYQ